MISWKTSLTVLVVATVLALTRPAQAVTCTVSGTLSLLSQDAYHCDTTVLGAAACSGWKVVNLTSAPAKLQYMYIAAFKTDGTYLKATTTDANGYYSLTFTLGGTQCSGQTVEMRSYFARALEADVGLEFPRWRFWITHLQGTPPTPDNVLWSKPEDKVLSGPNSTYNQQWGRPSTQSTTRVANVYFTVSEMLKEVKNWSSNLDAAFTYASIFNPPYTIGMGSSATVGGWANPYEALIGWDDYAGGGFIRHEFGHAIHGHIHKLARDSNCETYNFKSVGNHHPRSCEYGPAALKEGLASFFAVRSVTESVTNSWFCSCHDKPVTGGQNWNICSDRAALSSDPDDDPDDDDDWLYDCGIATDLDKAPGDFWYLGDARVSASSDCAELVFEMGCDCPSYTFDPVKNWSWCGANPSDNTYVASHGFRNEVQVSRFFWDVIDDNNDSGLDDTFLSIGEFVADMESMPCVGNLGGVNGSCEEQAPPPGGGCVPSFDGAYWPDAGAGPSGTRDSYNTEDFSVIFAGSQTGEKQLNCVQGAL